MPEKRMPSTPQVDVIVLGDERLSFWMLIGGALDDDE
jgi:hypothetical protein